MLAVKRKHRHKNKFGGKSFVILPIIFFIGILTVLYASFAPVLSPVVSAMDMLFTSSQKDLSAEYEDLFVPVSEETTISSGNSEKKSEEEPEKNTIKNENIVFPHYGDRFGQLIISDCGIDCPLFMGDGDVALRNGAGVYYGSRIPGYGGTTLVAAHNNTFFNGLKNAAEGQEIMIRTSYGNFRYIVKGTAIKNALDVTAYDLAADYENLVLYTCYPFDEIGLTKKRFFVYAELTDG